MTHPASRLEHLSFTKLRVDLEAAPVIDGGLALLAGQLVDCRIAIHGVVREVRRRKLLENAARIGPEAMPDTGENKKRIAGLEHLHAPIYLDIERTPQDEERLFL